MTTWQETTTAPPSGAETTSGVGARSPFARAGAAGPPVETEAGLAELQALLSPWQEGESGSADIGTAEVPLAHESPEASQLRLSGVVVQQAESPSPADLWVPGAERITSTRRGGTYVQAPWRFVFHTIEGEPSPAAFRGLATGHANPPHLWAMPSANLLLQSIPLNRSAYALARPGPTMTNRMRAVQVELWGFAATMGTVGPDVVAWLAERLLAPVARLVPIDLTSVRPAGSGVHCYGTRSSCRMTAAQWQSFAGVCGHKDVPDNAHWDPGQLPMAAIADRARTLLAPVPTPTPGGGASRPSYVPAFVQRERVADHDGPGFEAEHDDSEAGGYETNGHVTEGFGAEGFGAEGFGSVGYETDGPEVGHEAHGLGPGSFEGETPVDRARSTIVAQTRRWGTDEAAVMAALRALSPAEMAQLAADAGTVDALRSELSGADLAAAGAQLARGRVGGLAAPDLARIIAAPTPYGLGVLAGALGRDVLLRHQAAVAATGTGTIHGSRCPTPAPGGTTKSDCTEYVKDVLSRAFAAKGQAAVFAGVLATALRTSGSAGLKGTELIKALQAAQQWEALFWAPDPQNPSDSSQEHPYAYKVARDKGTYYGIPLLTGNAVVNYRRTAAGATADRAGIERLRRLPFGVLAARGGMHMALVISGSVHEVHWTAPATDRNAIEATPLESFAWLSGAIAAPRGDIGLAWRAP